MCGKNLWKIPIEPSTIGYMCKELQSIYSDNDGGMAQMILNIYSFVKSRLGQECWTA